MLAGSRISQHIRECNHHHTRLNLALGLRFGFSHTTTLRISSFFAMRSPLVAVSHKRSNSTSSSSSSSSSIDSGPSPSTQFPVLSDCFSQQEDDHEPPPEGLVSVSGGIVALGKFEALHVGHRELAIQAAKVGVPYLLSFAGMAEVLGWEPRAPIVAKCDRKRVLSTWAPYCGNVIPVEYQVEFSKVRSLSARQFVEKLSKELGVHGVVAGENYRFGYKAAGNASELVRLCEEYGMVAYIIHSVMDQSQDSRRSIGSNSNPKEQGQVSSTRVRHALAEGDMKYVSELLGRQHRLMLMVKDKEWTISDDQTRKVLSARKSCMLNLPPKEGLHESCSLYIASENAVPCRVSIDATHIHLELDDITTYIISQDLRCLGIEFGYFGA